MTRHAIRLCAAFSALLGMAVAGSAAATPMLPNCSDVAQTNKTAPLYVVGASAALPLVARLAAQLNLETTQASTLFFQPSGSCAGLDAFVADKTPLMSNETFPPGTCSGAPCITGLADYFTYTTGQNNQITMNQCVLDAGGVHADLVLSIVDAAACGQTLSSNDSDTVGPAVPLAFAVPASTRVDSINSLQGYFVFGFQCGGEIQPWTDSTEHFVASPKSGTAVLLEQLIGLPANAIHGVAPPDFSASGLSGSESVAQSLTKASHPGAAIGMLPSSIMDEYRTGKATPNSPTLVPLAFAAKGQNLAYFPDSDATTFDKRNVRDGHYPAFGYLHLITRLGPNRLPAPLNAKFLVDVFTGQQQFSGGFDVFPPIAQSGFIPQCAMTIKRVSDEPGRNGALQVIPYQDPAPCDCAFESAANPNHTQPVQCVPCNNDSDCKAGALNVCRRGFCEAQ